MTDFVFNGTHLIEKIDPVICPTMAATYKYVCLIALSVVIMFYLYQEKRVPKWLFFGYVAVVGFVAYFL